MSVKCNPTINPGDSLQETPKGQQRSMPIILALVRQRQEGGGHGQHRLEILSGDVGQTTTLAMSNLRSPSMLNPLCHSLGIFC